jgi:CBS domain-containing protein
MATIYDVVKHRHIESVDSEQTVLQAVQLMVKHNIGAVPIMREGELAGIFTERDLMKRVVAYEKDPATTPVSEVMTPNPLTVDINEPIENCMVMMKEHQFRHLPLCDGKKLVGMVSLRDMLLRDLTEKDHEVRLMRAYIQAVPTDI